MAKDLNTSMKIALDYYKCITEKCKKEEKDLELIEKKSIDFITTRKSKENQKLLECAVDKCRESAIGNLSNLRNMYLHKKDIRYKKACMNAEKLLMNPEKITPKSYSLAIINFYF